MIASLHLKEWEEWERRDEWVLMANFGLGVL